MMDVNTKLLSNQGKLLKDAGRYKRLVKKLNYLTMIRLNITFAVSILSQFLSVSRTTHLEAIMRILSYLKKAPEIGLLYSDQEHIRVADFSDAE